MRHQTLSPTRAVVMRLSDQTILFEFVGHGADQVAEKVAAKPSLLAATTAVAPLLERHQGVRLRWSRYITLLSPEFKAQDYTCGDP